MLQCLILDLDILKCNPFVAHNFSRSTLPSLSLCLSLSPPLLPRLLHDDETYCCSNRQVLYHRLKVVLTEAPLPRRNEKDTPDDRGTPTVSGQRPQGGGRGLDAAESFRDGPGEDVIRSLGSGLGESLGNGGDGSRRRQGQEGGWVDNDEDEEREQTAAVWRLSVHSTPPADCRDVAFPSSTCPFGFEVGQLHSRTWLIDP
jgi:hypothetical protein